MFNKETYNDYKLLESSLISGADTNLLVAQAVFGFYKLDSGWVTKSPNGDYALIELRIPDYSTDIKDAFLVEELCQAFYLEKMRKGNWCCELRLHNGDSIHQAHGTTELAICRAALYAAEEIYLKKVKHD